MHDELKIDKLLADTLISYIASRNSAEKRGETDVVNFSDSLIVSLCNEINKTGHCDNVIDKLTDAKTSNESLTESVDMSIKQLFIDQRANSLVEIINLQKKFNNSIKKNDEAILTEQHEVCKGLLQESNTYYQKTLEDLKLTFEGFVSPDNLPKESSNVEWAQGNIAYSSKYAPDLEGVYNNLNIKLGTTKFESEHENIYDTIKTLEHYRQQDLLNTPNTEESVQ